MSIYEILEARNQLISFIDEHPDKSCIVTLYGSKQKCPEGEAPAGKLCMISTTLGEALEYLKDKGRYGGMGALSLGSKLDPIPFEDYGTLSMKGLSMRMNFAGISTSTSLVENILL